MRRPVGVKWDLFCFRWTSFFPAESAADAILPSALFMPSAQKQIVPKYQQARPGRPPEQTEPQDEKEKLQQELS
jgi:hypothetical protein